MIPKQLVLKWVEIFNRGAADEIAELYEEDAINHQVVNNLLEGKMAIKEMFIKEFARSTMVCLVENIFEDGDWAILEWKDPNGLRGCGFFRIVNDKIVFQRDYWDKLSFFQLQQIPVSEW